MELTGNIIKILPEQTGQGKTGSNWVKQEFVVETQEQYPKKVCISAWGERVEELKKFNTGDEVKLNISIESREYNERWYTDVRAWRIEKVAKQAAPQQSGTSAAPDYPEHYFNNSNDASENKTADDDLPF